MYQIIDKKTGDKIWDCENSEWEFLEKQTNKIIACAKERGDDYCLFKDDEEIKKESNDG